MGNAFVCFERHHEDWDKFKHITQLYTMPKEIPNQRMDLPLSAYLISSGHNSYLTGNQLTDASGTSTIQNSLLQGCRVIELDVYNEQSGYDGPVCKHGGTLTAPVSFKDCVAAVGEFSFKTSPYPVIITIENHTDEPNQIRMAEILRQVLGDKLYVPEENDAGSMWKSPEQLKNKVLIRTNVGKACAELKQLVYIANTKFKSIQAANESGSTSSSSFNENKAAKLLKQALLESGVALRASETGKEGSGGGQSGRLRLLDSFKKRPSKSNRSSSGSIPDAGSGKSDLADAAGQMVEQPADEMPEESVASVHSLTELYAYTSRNLMRVYPGGLRVDSSNYNPAIAWSAGACLAALNWQKDDQPVWINKAMFAQRGNCGYYLKPDWMLSAMDPTAAPPAPEDALNPLPSRQPRNLAVTIYSAYAQQYNNMSIFKDDVYITMEVSGMPMDCRKQHTPVANNTGRLQVNTTYTFSVIYPELAVMVISLKDEDATPGKEMDDILGHWEVGLDSLREGSYKVLMTDLKGRTREDRWVRLQFKWEDPVPIVETSATAAPVAVPDTNECTATAAVPVQIISSQPPVATSHGQVATAQAQSTTSDVVDQQPSVRRVAPVDSN